MLMNTKFSKKGRKVTNTPTQQKIVKKQEFDIKLFGKWESKAQISDPSLRHYINLDARLLPRSGGSNRGRFHKSKSHIVERLAMNCA